jgi:hypothetical protein
MLSKCANPGCSATFLYLHQGKLFRHENETNGSENPDPTTKKPSQRIEFFWLCDDCASTMTLKYKKGVGITAVPAVQAPMEKSEPPPHRPQAASQTPTAQAAALGT